MKTLQDLFLEELADMYDAEKRIVKALPKLAKATSCEKLKAAFQNHQKETEGQIQKLEQVFQAFGEKAKGQPCEATIGLLKEGDEIAADFKGSPALDAALICAAQKVEHYEIASYGCLHAWATRLGNDEAASLLEEILEEEKGANDTLNELAEEKNEEALGESEENTDEEEAAPKRAVKPAAGGAPVKSGRSNGGKTMSR